ncbi:Fic family protein [Ligilactobacillus salivarius]|uniref:Huntingtin interacting protein E-like protein n=1 Tax=Ligilactobacillus salivarius TaxID=1624 RepID=A0A9X6XJI6_9LACO|nr:Fic family protein [Ligilactobacillus salivarius]OTF88619.1 huntingtin interacting protein E-like protein [Ligilactobacillus salivarius]PAY25890.1 huntingtin interacting protein E-like protein [Ligilactobacillus salivarius]PAY28302.1 huntingtin interacting protein E-like protein [Ligilactobacillus salivarius]PAY31392.1 huntingtin interacting protein E-like protein [Ligilactobacillus salivarius]PAY36768.1 huntingtin interacting protein E-like protein [Ligilactobacillus salivarius]
MDQKLEKLSLLKPLTEDKAKRLAKEAKLEHIWSSNALEGNSLTLEETSSIINDGITVGKSVKETLEAINLSQAYDYMLLLAEDKQELTETVIKKLNRLVMFNTAQPHELAGTYRKVKAWPKEYEEQPYVSPTAIADNMKQLINWSKKNKERLHPVIYAADLHQKFVSIHPFTDGNGRTARLLMNLALIQADYPVINISPTARQEYMETLAKSRKNGKVDIFEKFIAGYMIDKLS